MITWWYLVYTIVLFDGPPTDTQGQPRTYPHYDRVYEPPSGDWLGCYHQKRVGLPARRIAVAQSSKAFTVEATCESKPITHFK